MTNFPVHRFSRLVQGSPQVVMFGNIEDTKPVGIECKNAGMKVFLPLPPSKHAAGGFFPVEVPCALEMIDELPFSPTAVVLNLPGFKKLADTPFEIEPVMSLAATLKERGIPLLVRDMHNYQDFFTGDEKQMMADVGIRYVHVREAPPEKVPSILQEMIGYKDKGLGMDF